MSKGKKYKIPHKYLSKYPIRKGARYKVMYSPINKYDMLCISNFIDAKTLKKNSCDDYRKWKGICSRFKYVVCCPNPQQDE